MADFEATWEALCAGLREGDDSAAPVLADTGERLTSDFQLVRSVETLIHAGHPQLASRLLDACRGRKDFLPGMIAVADCQVQAACGRLTEAVAVLDAEITSPRPMLIALRHRSHVMEAMLDFAGAQAVRRRAALTWGDEHDLRQALNRLTYLFAWAEAESLLAEFAAHHPVKTPLTRTLGEELTAARAEPEAALARFGPVAGVESRLIHEILSAKDAEAGRILWAKQALAALLRGDAITEDDYRLFAWFLPNWEEGLVREHVLGAARARLPSSLTVMRGWLHYLITRAAYGEAARCCLSLLRSEADENSLFFAIILLRLQAAGVAPAFMDPRLFDDLRAEVFARTPMSEAGFRCVMAEHLAALGAPLESWPLTTSPLNAPESLGLRRLFAVTTGRLSPVAMRRASSADPPIRPVIAISGQLRGFDAAWASQYEHLCRPANAPVIVTVWDRSANATGRHAKRLERALPDDVVDRLKPEERFTDVFAQAYPRTYQLLFGQTEVTVEGVSAIVSETDARLLIVETESEGLIEQVLHPHISANMLKMYYKFARVEALVREQEARSGELFSHVIWARPDCAIVRLAAADLTACLARADLVWSSFVTESSFGDYVMILPRRAFATVASIFPRVVLAGDTRLLPWRPRRPTDPVGHPNLDSFGGPDLIFDMLLAGGYNPLGRIPRMATRLLGRTPGADLVRRTFDAEHQARS